MRIDLGKLLIDVLFRAHLPAELLKAVFFLRKISERCIKDLVLRLPHPDKLLVGEVQHLHKGELLVDRVGSVEGAAVGTLHAGNARRKIFFERMPVNRAKVVQADIGRDLEFEDRPGLAECLDQLPALDGA